MKELKKNGISADRNNTVFVFVKKSIDARHGQLKLHLRYKAYIGETPADTRTSELPVWKKADGSKKIIIIGAGPAGLFGALTLLEYGITPIIIRLIQADDWSEL